MLVERLQQKKREIALDNFPNDTPEEDIIKDLEILDGVIYKEGREKRSKQNLKESVIGSIKKNSGDYDEMLESLTDMRGIYKKMTKWCSKNAPELLEGSGPS